MTSLWQFNFGLGEVEATVTNQATVIDKWIRNVARLCPPSQQVIVGWALERGCFHKAATLQLCLISRCIIVQLVQLKNIPISLLSFLASPNVVCAGVVEDREVAELFSEHGIKCTKTHDIRELGINFMPNKLFKEPGLEDLARHILKLEVPKPESITYWERLTLDAYACYLLGHALL